MADTKRAADDTADVRGSRREACAQGRRRRRFGQRRSRQQQPADGARQAPRTRWLTACPMLRRRAFALTMLPRVPRELQLG
jgi:hypothetical protein